MNQISPVTLALDERKCVLELVRWQDMRGGPMFAYVLMKKARLPEFKNSLLRQDTDLAAFGVVVAEGSGSAPPSGFEQKVLEAILKVA